ncbi:redox-regulated ATPase YchF [Candidatus Bathyarchaeota archaeon]|nr:MAG: redox-regulated ATPase YchF [Candidatus Bathyarchaeota archaeon]RLG97518.1 MAG: redox-regulated ATPase YchF [Candidatus Bathyarchaeota archaeon]
MTFLVGIVGKPNVGKSTFFSAATLATVEIASYPFTTIKPNRGIAYLRVKCVCKEFGVQDNPVNSICTNGVRLIPVELIDCAGLVPDAWRGRGLGNRFLDEIRRADALIHVVDASGSTDLEGRAVKPGFHDPVEDVLFLEKEITMWIVQILNRGWPRLARTVEAGAKDLYTSLEERLSGLAIKRSHIVEAVRRAHLDGEKPTKWSKEDLIKFVDELRKASKPMLLAANKIDLPGAEENVERLRELGYIVVPCCAEAELALRRAAEKSLIEYVPGDPDFTIKNPEKMTEAQLRALRIIRERVLAKFGGTGVQEAINAAFFKLLKMIVVYPVEDPERLTDHNGRVLPEARLVTQGTTARELAYKIHTELGESFIYAVDARTKRRLGEDYVLKDGDVISIVSAKKRA